MIPHSKPYVGNKEASAVRRVILSGQLAQGKEAALLESELCSYVGHRYGLAVSSGTAALYGALKLLSISSGDKVVIPSYACTALANAVYMSGALPVVCDVEYTNGLMSVETVRASLVKNVRAVIVPHLFGNPAAAHQIEYELGIPVIEDCAQCLGATIDGKNVGSLTSIATFSFYATKVIGAGEGGLIATSDRHLAKKMSHMREYDNCPSYKPSFNLKLSDVHASIARVQLERLPKFINRRRLIAKRYDEAIQQNKLITKFPSATTSVTPMYYRYIIKVNRRQLHRIMKYFNSNNVSCARPIYKPFHRYGTQEKCPVSDRLYNGLLSIPIYPALTNVEVNAVMSVLASVSKV